jgi:hypothetical protein
MKQPSQRYIFGRYQLPMGKFQFIVHGAEYPSKLFDAFGPVRLIHRVPGVITDVVRLEQDVLKFGHVRAVPAEKMTSQRHRITKNNISRLEVEGIKRICSGKKGGDFSSAHRSSLIDEAQNRLQRNSVHGSSFVERMGRWNFPFYRHRANRPLDPPTDSGLSFARRASCAIRDWRPGLVGGRPPQCGFLTSVAWQASISGGPCWGALGLAGANYRYANPTRFRPPIGVGEAEQLKRLVGDLP